MSTTTSAESGYKSGTFVFDSYAYVRRLREAGMDEQQAAIQAETFMALAEDRLATKQDIAGLTRDIEATKAGLTRDIEATKTELTRDIEATKAELKRDIEAIQTELKRDIAAIDAKVETTKAELRRDIETAKVETIKWVVITGIAILGGVTALIRFVPPLPAYYQLPAQEMRQIAPAPSAPLAGSGTKAP